MQAQGPVRTGVEGDNDEGVSETKESEPNRITSTQPSVDVEEEPLGSLKTVIVTTIAHRSGRRPRVGGNP